MFDKVLIANRGEIALRIARACREMGIATVAVYSTEDRDSAVVAYADEAVHIGPGPAKRSYMCIPALVEAAKKTRAQAVHPGYGFLSEDADFAEVCEQHGLVFVGPPPKVIDRLGDKCAARGAMAQAGLPILPGSHGPVRSAADARETAERVGFPVIVKAVAGGGGRGMRVAHDSDEAVDAFESVSREAQALFADAGLYIERYVDPARHVEVQVLCDTHGRAVHLGTRDCSVQRRHQKLLEETPAVGLSHDVVQQMGEASVAAAKEVGYVGAGTFEFLVDADERFYFMEANCRLQVEHPVTEMATAVDLVQEQLRVAAGGHLGLKQHDVVGRGVAIEARINMEDPSRSFVPTPGRIDSLTLPSGPFVRVDTHAYAGYRMPAIYDSLLAKVVVWAPTRPQAIARMARALDEVRVTGEGLSTTAPFLRQVMADSEFQAGRHHTGIVARLLDPSRRIHATV